MSFDLQRMLASKRALRQKLAARPVAEKLRLLDELRERELSIRRVAPPAPGNIVRERLGSYPVKRKR